MELDLLMEFNLYPYVAHIITNLESYFKEFVIDLFPIMFNYRPFSLTSLINLDPVMEFMVMAIPIVAEEIK